MLTFSPPPPIGSEGKTQVCPNLKETTRGVVPTGSDRFRQVPQGPHLRRRLDCGTRKSPARPSAPSNIFKCPRPTSVSLHHTGRAYGVRCIPRERGLSAKKNETTPRVDRQSIAVTSDAYQTLWSRHENGQDTVERYRLSDQTHELGISRVLIFRHSCFVSLYACLQQYHLVALQGRCMQMPIRKSVGRRSRPRC